MKVRWEIDFDLGSLLTADNPEVNTIFQLQYIYENTKLPILEIESLRIRISADKPLLHGLFK